MSHVHKDVTGRNRYTPLSTAASHILASALRILNEKNVLILNENFLPFSFVFYNHVW